MAAKEEEEEGEEKVKKEMKKTRLPWFHFTVRLQLRRVAGHTHTHKSHMWCATI